MSSFLKEVVQLIQAENHNEIKLIFPTQRAVSLFKSEFFNKSQGTSDRFF